MAKVILKCEKLRQNCQHTSIGVICLQLSTTIQSLWFMAICVVEGVHRCMHDFLNYRFHLIMSREGSICSISQHGPVCSYCAIRIMGVIRA
jgi:hypothetical protein